MLCTKIFSSDEVYIYSKQNNVVKILLLDFIINNLYRGLKFIFLLFTVSIQFHNDLISFLIVVITFTHNALQLFNTFIYYIMLSSNNLLWYIIKPQFTDEEIRTQFCCSRSEQPENGRVKIWICNSLLFLLYSFKGPLLSHDPNMFAYFIPSKNRMVLRFIITIDQIITKNISNE